MPLVLENSNLFPQEVFIFLCYVHLFLTCLHSFFFFKEKMQHTTRLQCNGV